ncbi:MAG: hypothetical protein ACXWQO_13305 [Bdellovibrionota bacterium]
MKTIYLAVIACLLGTSAFAAQPEFETACKVSLTGMTSTTSLEGKSSAFDLYHGLAGSDARVVFGVYTIYAQVEMRRSAGDGEYEQSLLMQFYKGGNPVEGNLSLIFANGLDLESWAVGKTQSVSSLAFGEVQYEGKSYSRTDYTCGVKRVR